jgi:(+)-pinoresinol hydroxylase
MKGLQFRRGLAVAGCAVLAVALSACSLPAMRPVPQSAPPPEAAHSAGRNTFDEWCADCHRTAQGPGSLALQRKYRGSLPAILEQRSDLRPDYVKLVVRHGVSFMPSFRKTEISDADLALVAAYLAPSR